MLCSLAGCGFAAMADVLQCSPAARPARRRAVTSQPGSAGAGGDTAVQLAGKTLQDTAESSAGNSADGPLAYESRQSQRCY